MALTHAEMRRAEILTQLQKLAATPTSDTSFAVDGWTEPNGRYAATASWRDREGKWARVVVSGLPTRAAAERGLCAALAELVGGGM